MSLRVSMGTWSTPKNWEALSAFRWSKGGKAPGSQCAEGSSSELGHLEV